MSSGNSSLPLTFDFLLDFSLFSSFVKKKFNLLIRIALPLKFIQFYSLLDIKSRPSSQWKILSEGRRQQQRQDPALFWAS